MHLLPDPSSNATDTENAPIPDLAFRAVVASHFPWRIHPSAPGLDKHDKAYSQAMQHHIRPYQTQSIDRGAPPRIPRIVIDSSQNQWYLLLSTNQNKSKGLLIQV